MSLPEAGVTMCSSSEIGGTGRSVGRRSRVWATLILLAGSSAVLSACGDGGFRPLYGASGVGANVDEKLAQVEVVQIPGRVGQRIRNELIFQATKGGTPPPPTLRLEIAVRESVTSTLVRQDGDAEGQIYGLEAQFNLIRIADNAVVLKGTSFARAGFERFTSIFSNVRARNDAENRAAKSIGDDVKSRLMAYLGGAA